jgi:hypothetical protein
VGRAGLRFLGVAVEPEEEVRATERGEASWVRPIMDPLALGVPGTAVWVEVVDRDEEEEEEGEIHL